jgi:hypothetical protein
VRAELRITVDHHGWRLHLETSASVDVADPDHRRWIADLLGMAEHIVEHHPDKFVPASGATPAFAPEAGAPNGEAQP